MLSIRKKPGQLWPGFHSTGLRFEDVGCLTPSASTRLPHCSRCVNRHRRLLRRTPRAPRTLTSRAHEPSRAVRETGQHRREPRTIALAERSIYVRGSQRARTRMEDQPTRQLCTSGTGPLTRHSHTVQTTSRTSTRPATKRQKPSGGANPTPDPAEFEGSMTGGRNRDQGNN